MVEEFDPLIKFGVYCRNLSGFFSLKIVCGVYPLGCKRDAPCFNPRLNNINYPKGKTAYDLVAREGLCGW